MDVSITQLRDLCNNRSVRWTSHVLHRMLQRGISRADVLETINNGEIIEQYPCDYPFPSCLILGYTVSKRSLHVVCGVGENEAWMITAYYPSLTEWESDLKTRKQVQL